MIPLVAASDRGDSLNCMYVIACKRCAYEVVGLASHFAEYGLSYQIIY